MNVDGVTNGIVIDHIKAGKSMEIYHFLNLSEVDSSVAIIKNVSSTKYGKKDIIKIDEQINLDLDVLGYIDPNITVNIVQGGELKEKKRLALPAKLKNVIKCKNPRCITSIEQEIDNIFVLTDSDRGVYRCMYCETKAEQD
ncbi:aspartate carbamoyltransferase regulatory subunit [Clostridiaceae bacterium OttesenSCG-928-D20]|nr:aspartate carbamoyltransferase regulatory subunit [Clostridiaceae bacterium OttesenSCG-928-D20]